MMDRNNAKPIDYEASATERKRSFIARATGVVAGVVTGIVTGKYLLKRSLRHYLHDRLFARNWTDGSVEGVMRGMVNGEVDTISGATNNTESTARWLKSNGKEATHAPGTLIGDAAANKALKDLYAANLASDPSDKNVPVKLRDGFLKTAVDSYNLKLEEFRSIYNKKMSELKAKYLPDDIEKYQEDFRDVRKVLDTETNPAIREKAVKDFVVKVGFKGSLHKFLEEEQKIKANFIHFTDQAKKKIIDIPIYDEMMKTGNEPGRMGLKLRHAHDKKRLVLFAAGAAVGVGYIAYRGAKSYLHRNERGKDEERTFQEGVEAGREAAMHEQAGIA